MFENEKSKIEKTQEDLYSRNTPNSVIKDRYKIRSGEYKVNNQWKSEEEPPKKIITEEEKIAKQKSFFNKVLLSSIIFFVISLGAATFMVLRDSAVSPNKVLISADGLLSLAGGEEMNLNIRILNKNKIDLADSELLVEYPAGTRSASNVNEELTRLSETLGNISANGTATKNIKAILFGEKDSVQNIKVSVRYRTKGSDAVFTTKPKDIPVTISSSPINLAVSYPQEVNSGQSIDMAISVSSNSNSVIQDMLVKINYPLGFVFKSAEPAPAYGNNIWRVGDLKSKEKKVIDVKGTVEGLDNEEKSFDISAGVANSDDERKIGVNFVTTLGKITFKKPFIGLNVLINGSDEKDYVSKIGQQLQGQISLDNNLPVNINNAKVSIKLSGPIMNKSQVSAGDGGFYRSLDNTITWDKNGLPSLAQINSGGGSSLFFGFSSVAYSSNLITTFKNAEMTVDVNVTGDVKSDTLPSQVTSTFSKKIKIATELLLNTRLLYSTGPFKNSGPIPPKADNQTTYTVNWLVTNTFNDASGAVVKATLPPYVDWLGAHYPENEKISYNEDDRSITWEIGDVKYGAGFTSVSKEVSFQVGLTPSKNQVGGVPVVINEMTLTGKDNFTGKDVGVVRTALTTRISTDPKYNFGDEKVAE